MWLDLAEDLILLVSIFVCNVEVHVMKDREMTIGYVTLLTGIVLLAFTFISAYIFLISSPSITESSNLVDAFGESLAPLIEASIRIMFLGIMGWVGSILTARGVQLVTQLKRLANTEFRPMTPPVEKTEEPEKSKDDKKTDKT